MQDMRQTLDFLDETASRKDPPSRFREGDFVNCEVNGKCEVSGLSGWSDGKWKYKLKNEAGKSIDNVPQTNLSPVKESEAVLEFDVEKEPVDSVVIGDEVKRIGSDGRIGTVQAIRKNEDTGRVMAYVLPGRDEMSRVQGVRAEEDGTFGLNAAELEKYNENRSMNMEMEKALDELVGKVPENVEEARKDGEFRAGDAVSKKGSGKTLGIVDRIDEGEVWVVLNKDLKPEDVDIAGITEADFGRQVWFNPDEIELAVAEDGETENLPAVVKDKDQLPMTKDPKNDPFLNPYDKDKALHGQEVADAETVFAAAKAESGDDVATLNTLSTNGAFMNHKNEYGQNPLHVAAKNNGKYVPSVIDHLIYGGVQKNAMDNVGNRPLDMAAPGSEAEKWLRKRGAVDGDTALFVNGKPAEIGMHVAVRNFEGKGIKKTHSDEYAGVIKKIKQEDPNNPQVFMADVESDGKIKQFEVSRLVKSEAPPPPEEEPAETPNESAFPTVQETEKQPVSESQWMRNMLNMITETAEKHTEKV